LLALGVLAAGGYFVPTVTSLALLLLGLGAPLFWLVWRRPELGLLGLIFLTSSFIRPDTIDLRLSIGGLDLRDLALVGMLGMLILQRLMRGELTVPWWPVSGPLLVFMGLAIFSALYALSYQGVEPNWALGEFRALVFYLVFFVTIWAITRPGQLIVLLVGLFLLADLTAAVVILQQFFGTDNPLLRVMSGGYAGWQVWRAGDPLIGFGAVRIIPPGHVLVFMMTIVAFCLVVMARRKLPLRAMCMLQFQFAFLNVGLLFTYTRAQWLASVVALGIVFLLLPVGDKRWLIRSVAIGLLLLFLVYVLLGVEVSEIWERMPFVQTLVSRALSILTPRETLETFSLEWRIYETREALRSIAQHPLLGVGLGNAYRDITLLQGEARSGYFRFIRYVHSSYLYVAVKMGLPGLIAFLWFCAAFVARSLWAYAHMSDRLQRSVVLAVLASFVGLLVWSVYHSHFLQVESAAVIGLMSGMIASIRQIAGLDSHLTGEPE